MPDQYSKLVGHPLKYPYVVGITTESGDLGTGILISDRFVLSCGHVLDDSPSAQVVFREGTMRARVRKVDDSLDLALLELTQPISVPKANFTEVPLRPSAVVLAVGVQETLGKSDELSVAEIELKFRNQNVADGKILDIQLDGGARPGYSGGPVVVERGRALLCVGVLRSGGAGANTSNAVGLAPIRAFVGKCVPDMLEDQSVKNTNSIRGRFILTTALLGVFGLGTIAGWHYLAPSSPRVTSGVAIVTTQEPQKTASDQSAPGKDTPKAPIRVPSPQTSEESLLPKHPNQGNPAVKVWVNTPSNVYHCPGTRWYGTTKHGEYMAQAEAQKKGNRPAYGKVCK
jgi:Trypsin-like peptidase domain